MIVQKTAPVNPQDCLGARDRLATRLKVGVIVPSTNTIVQPEFTRMSPAGVTTHTARAPIPNRPLANDDDFRALIGDIEAVLDDTVRQLISCDPDCVVLGMSAETFWRGGQGADMLLRRLEDVARRPVTLGSHACDAALKRFGIKHIAVVTPYMPVGDIAVEGFFDDLGIDVKRIVGFRCPSPTAIAHVTEAALRQAVNDLDGDDIDAIVQVGTNLCFAETAAQETALRGKPVIAINTATFWSALRGAGIADHFEGFGPLFASH